MSVDFPQENFLVDWAGSEHLSPLWVSQNIHLRKQPHLASRQGCPSHLEVITKGWQGTGFMICKRGLAVSNLCKMFYKMELYTPYDAKSIGVELLELGFHGSCLHSCLGTAAPSKKAWTCSMHDNVP